MAKVKIKLLTDRMSLETGYSKAGDVIEVDSSEARSMLEAGLAEPVAETRAKRASRATSKPVETR